MEQSMMLHESVNYQFSFVYYGLDLVWSFLLKKFSYVLLYYKSIT